jgi:hypothetical protein
MQEGPLCAPGAHDQVDGGGDQRVVVLISVSEFYLHLSQLLNELRNSVAKPLAVICRKLELRKSNGVAVANRITKIDKLNEKSLCCFWGLIFGHLTSRFFARNMTRECAHYCSVQNAGDGGLHIFKRLC